MYWNSSTEWQKNWDTLKLQDVPVYTCSKYLKITGYFENCNFSLTETKRRLIVKSSQLFDSPLVAYEALKSGKNITTVRHKFKVGEQLYYTNLTFWGSLFHKFSWNFSNKCFRYFKHEVVGCKAVEQWKLWIIKMKLRCTCTFITIDINENLYKEIFFCILYNRRMLLLSPGPKPARYKVGSG